MKITILGCGASGGVPLVGPNWGNCDPNVCGGSSILIQDETTDILVDATPDCREQLLGAEVSRLDAVLFTHAHADHCHGIDELRWINNAMGHGLDAFSDPATYQELKTRFGYAFEPLEAEAAGYYYRPSLNWRAYQPSASAGDLTFQTFEQDHGYSKTVGFRFGKAAYTTDVVALEGSVFELLKGIELWVIGCLREEAHPTHANVETAITWVERVKPRRAILTHMSHWLDYRHLCDILPEGIEPAHDGMTIEL